MIISIIIIISWFISLWYILYIFRFYYSWDRLEYIKGRKESINKISVVIALRNEERNIGNLLSSIASQDYKKDSYEIILINDHSEDKSVTIIEEFQRKHPDINIHLYSLTAEKEGKKEALRMAYELAKYNIIACTDGDCILPVNWLSITSKAFDNSEKILFSGGVYLTNEKSFLDNFQSLELMSLVGSGAASIGLNKPIMCNGANMAFRKSLLNKVPDDLLQSKLASGDDVFLLMECKRVCGSKSIGFIKNKEHWVQTFTEPSLASYLNQRIRWVSKSSSYSDFNQILLSILILLQNLIIVILMFTSVLSLYLLQTLIFIFILKSLTDFFFLRNISTYLSQKRTLKMYLLISLVYPFFIVFVALTGQISSFQWKGRKYEK